MCNLGVFTGAAGAATGAGGGGGGCTKMGGLGFETGSSSHAGVDALTSGLGADGTDGEGAGLLEPIGEGLIGVTGLDPDIEEPCVAGLVARAGRAPVRMALMSGWPMGV